jgi:hypothetical protein
MAELAGP